MDEAAVDLDLVHLEMDPTHGQAGRAKNGTARELEPLQIISRKIA
ncbi:MAG TPA: hypothetical protein VK638_23690 [Edaphobacter sp.]|nr:hypothetical protein [Edaphobacter sp.]